MTLATDNANFVYDFSSITPNAIELSEDSIAWATQVCRSITDGEEQWQAFLRAMAVAGFEQWLNNGALSFKSRFNRQDVSQEAIPSLGVNFWVEGYRLCLLVVGNLYEKTINVLTGVVGEMAHVYVLVEVQEEINQVKIIAGLQREQLLQIVEGDLQQSNNQTLSPHILSPQIQNHHIPSQQTLQVPITQFKTQPEQLRLQLSCLAPATVTTSVMTSSSQRIGLGAIANQVINVGQWLQGELDEVSKQFSWALLPPMVVVSGMRSGKKTIKKTRRVRSGEEAIEKALGQFEKDKGFRLPKTAVGASRTVTIGSLTCCLCGVVWPEAEGTEDEWNLLVLLGPLDNEMLPEGIQLKVSDAANPLTASTLERTTDIGYLYSQVRGDKADRFWVQITLLNGQTKTVLPPFGFA